MSDNTPIGPKPEVPTEIKKLPEMYRVDSSFEYHLVARNENAAIYKDAKSNNWEVFRVKLRKGRVGMIKGNWVVFQTAERVPTDNDFGFWAFHHSNEKIAMEKYEMLSKLPPNAKLPG